MTTAIEAVRSFKRNTYRPTAHDIGKGVAVDLVLALRISDPVDIWFIALWANKHKLVLGPVYHEGNLIYFPTMKIDAAALEELCRE